MAVYATSDWHGCYWCYEKLKEFLKPEDTVIYLGDAGDRGPQPWKTIKAIIDDKQFKYIQGNHENMLINSFKQRGAEDLLYANGGERTQYECIRDQEGKEYLGKLIDKMVNLVKYENSEGQLVFLSHAGFNPSYYWTQEGLVEPDEETLIWDRGHMHSSWNSEILPSNLVLVHGHTPLKEPHCLWYCDKHKVDIDIGCVWTGKFALLNLDTWEEIIFTEED